MSNYIYWPYDEVSLETNNDDGQIFLKAPWLEARTAQALFEPRSLQDLAKKMNEKRLSVDDLGLVNDFFRHFEAYPFAYILPTPKDGDALDRHAISDTTFGNQTLVDALRSALADCSELTEGDLDELNAIIARTEWEWDVNSALQFASCNDAIHPESFFSIARRYHLLEILSNQSLQSVFQSMASLSKNQVKPMLASLVRQNHYVTQKCQEALLPAVQRAKSAAPLVEAFMNEERGHDKILQKALLHMNETPEAIEVNAPTIALMHLLKLCAQHNFLAFAMAVDAFERSNFEDVDPMAKLLLAHGFDKSAEFINLHMKINDNGNHDNVAAQFLQSMTLCDASYAFEAMRLMELVSVVMCSVSKSVPLPRPSPA